MFLSLIFNYKVFPIGHSLKFVNKNHTIGLVIRLCTYLILLIYGWELKTKP